MWTWHTYMILTEVLVKGGKERNSWELICNFKKFPAVLSYLDEDTDFKAAESKARMTKIFYRWVKGDVVIRDKICQGDTTQHMSS